MEHIDSLTLNLEDYNKWHRERDIRNGMNPSVYKTHIISYSYIVEYIQDRVKEVDEDYNKLYTRFHNFRSTEDWDNFDEFKILSDEFNNAIPSEFKNEIFKKLIEERKNTKTKVITSQPMKKEIHKEESNTDVDINW